MPHIPPPLGQQISNETLTLDEIHDNDSLNVQSIEAVDSIVDQMDKEENFTKEALNDH